MSSTLATMLAAALAAQSVPDRPASPPELALLEATVTKAEEVVARPMMIVAVGQDGEITMAPSRTGPAIRMQFRVEQASTSARRASVTTFLDGQKVVAGHIDYTSDGEATAQWVGGGLSWMVRVARMTPELVERRKREASTPK